MCLVLHLIRLKPMANTKAERLSAIEAARAVTIASHAAAGLAARAGATHVVRALRVAEAMGRSATAMLVAHFDAPVGTTQPPPATKPGDAEARDANGGVKSGAAAKRGSVGKGKKDNQTEAKDDKGRGKQAGGEEASGLSKRQRKRRARRQRKAATAAFDDTFADALPVRRSGAAEGAAPAAALEISSFMAEQDAVLRDVQRAFAKADREKVGGSAAKPAPAVPPSAKGASASASVDSEMGAGPSASPHPVRALRAGDVVTILDLRSRPELNGEEHQLKEFDVRAGRWCITLPDLTIIRVLEKNLLLSSPPAKKQQVFKGGEDK